MLNKIPALHKSMMLIEAVLKNLRKEQDPADGTELLLLASDLLRVVMQRPTRNYSVEYIKAMFEHANNHGA